MILLDYLCRALQKAADAFCGLLQPSRRQDAELQDVTIPDFLKSTSTLSVDSADQDGLDSMKDVIRFHCPDAEIYVFPDGHSIRFPRK